MVRATSLIGVGLLLITGGCGAMKAEEIAACEAELLPTLKSPSTYQLIDSVASTPSANGTREVYLTYDAVNSYNAPVRGTFACRYDTKTKTATDRMPEISKSLDEKAEEIVAKAEAESRTPDASIRTSKPRVEPKPEPIENVPVCDRPDSEEKFRLMNEIGTNCLGE